jgi:hypothetical protein
MNRLWANRIQPRWSNLLACLLAISSTGCLSPLTIERAGVEYDRAVTNVITEQLILNIARAKHHHPIHFTVVSNVAATFDYRVSAGITAPQRDASPSLLPVFTNTVAENPTVSIVPVEGEEFTKRLLTPLDETRFYFLSRQGVDLNVLLRLLAREFRGEGGQEEQVFANDPSRESEYREFRRRVLHLSALQEARKLYVEPMAFEKNWELPLGSAEAFQALEKGYHLTLNPQTQLYHLQKQVNGRVVITNYNPDILSKEVRYHLHLEASNLPQNQIFVDIRPGYPGGEYPFRGSFSFRSFNAMLRFLAAGIEEEPEYDVAKDPRSGQVRFNPPRTIEIVESNSKPANAAFAVSYGDRVYSIKRPSADDTAAARWNLEAFRMLYMLFQMTVTDVSKVLVPSITIAK